MTSDREAGLRVVRELLPELFTDDQQAGSDSEAFGSELLDLSIDNVFGRLWGRDGLSRRDRSLVTLGVLIALRASEELEFHFPIARRNGLTDDELAEVIYHCSGYAGFPAAASARTIAAKVLKESGETPLD